MATVTERSIDSPDQATATWPSAVSPHSRTGDRRSKVRKSRLSVIPMLINRVVSLSHYDQAVKANSSTNALEFDSSSETPSMKSAVSFDFTQPNKTEIVDGTAQTDKIVDATTMPSPMHPRENITSAMPVTPSSNLAVCGPDLSTEHAESKHNMDIIIQRENKVDNMPMSNATKRLSTVSIASSFMVLAPYILASPQASPTGRVTDSLRSSHGRRDSRTPMRTRSSACRISRVAQLAATSMSNIQGAAQLAVTDYTKSLDSQFNFDVPEMLDLHEQPSACKARTDARTKARRRSSVWIFKRQTPIIEEDEASTSTPCHGEKDGDNVEKEWKPLSARSPENTMRCEAVPDTPGTSDSLKRPIPSDFGSVKLDAVSQPAIIISTKRRRRHKLMATLRSIFA